MQNHDDFLKNLTILKSDFAKAIHAALIVAHDDKKNSRNILDYLDSKETSNCVEVHSALTGKRLRIFSDLDFQEISPPVCIPHLLQDKGGLVNTLVKAKAIAINLFQIKDLEQQVFMLTLWLIIAAAYIKENPDPIFQAYLDRVASIYSRKIYKKLLDKYEKISPDIIGGEPDVASLMAYLEKTYPHLDLAQIPPDTEGALPTIKAFPLFQRGPYQAVDSSMIADTLYSILVGKTLELEPVNDTTYVASKVFKNGVFSITAQLSSSAKEDLIRLGRSVRKVLNSLIAYWLNHPTKEFLLEASGAEILTYMNQLYPRDANGNWGKKLEGLDGLAQILKLIENIRVYTGVVAPEGKGKRNFTIESTPLFYLSYSLAGHQNFFNNEVNPITDLKIKFKPGDWVNYLQSNDTKYYKFLGYQPQQAWLSKEYDCNLLDWLSFKLEQNKSGRFKIKTILDETGYKTTLEEIMANHKSQRNRAQYLFQTFNNTIENIRKLSNPYDIEYQNPPEWLINSDLKKPKGWLKIWLNTRIVFTKPEILLAGNSQKALPKSTKNTPQKADKPKLLTCEDLEQALKATKVSGRSLSIWYAKPYNWLSKKLKDGSLTSKEIKELLKGVEFLSKNKDK